MKPILKYRGGKSREIPQFISYIPTDFDTYIEPFLGGGAVYFYLNHRPSIINDVNEKLMTFYKQLRNNFDEVKRQLKSLQEQYELNQSEYEQKKALVGHDERVENKNEALYYFMRDEFNYPSGEFLEAVVYFFINKTAYSGMIRYNQSGEYNVPFGRYKNFNTGMITQKHHELLKNTQVLNTDFSEVFAMAKENDFMFLDPPYDTTFHDYGNDQPNGFTEEEHIRLAREFRDLRCKALMIIGRTDLTERLYGDYVLGSYHKKYAVNIRNRFKNEAKHLIIANYAPANATYLEAAAAIDK